MDIFRSLSATLLTLLLLGEQILTICVCIKRMRLIEILSFMMYKLQLTLVKGPMSRTIFLPMAKHESKSTYICMNIRITEKNILRTSRIRGYLLTIALVCSTSLLNIICCRKRYPIGSGTRSFYNTNLPYIIMITKNYENSVKDNQDMASFNCFIYDFSFQGWFVVK